ncbi:acyl-ACP--UDP-N-acetylglucosamine O-acyltransferase [bacterium]|nr:acyl-ACP--UDP-N-acetylglucosamine O-acyltransferase [candidate division CSSED10-310 bacterium]
MIDSRAIIDPKAGLSSDVHVGPFTIIGPDVTIDSGTWIGSHVIIEGITAIGKNNHVNHHAVLGAAPQDLKYRGEPTKLTIQDDNIIREFTTLHRGTPGGGGETKIGNRCMLMAYVHVAHDCHIGNEVIIANAVNMAGHVTIEDFAIVGGMCAIHQFVRIGRYAFIGGATPLAQDVIPFGLVAGPRGELKGINIVGLKRRGFESERRDLLKRVVRDLIGSEMNVSQVLNGLKDEGLYDHPDIRELMDFIRQSERGLCL